MVKSVSFILFLFFHCLSIGVCSRASSAAAAKLGRPTIVEDPPKDAAPPTTTVPTSTNSTQSSVTLSPEEQGLLISGLHGELLPSPIFYQNYMPLLLRIPLPVWNISSGSSPVPNILKAMLSSSSSSPSSPSSSNLALSYLHYTRLISSSSFCRRIQAHFLHPNLTPLQFGFYRRALHRCQLDWMGNAFSRSVPKTVFLEDTINLNETMGFEKDFSRLRAGLKDCLGSRIPSSLLDSSALTEHLHVFQFLSISRALKEDKDNRTKSYYQNHTLSTYNLATLYSLPLADCALVNDSILLRILLPTKRVDLGALGLFRVHSIPFQVKGGHICRVGGNHPRPYYIYEGGAAYPSECASAELCDLSEYAGRDGDRCGSSALAPLLKEDNPNPNPNHLKDHCQVVCKKEGEVKLSESPLITRLHANQYVITGSPFTISVQCSGGGGNVSTGVVGGPILYSILAESIGAHMISLPCGCSFTFVDTKLEGLQYFGEGPCANETLFEEEEKAFERVIVRPVIPLHFAKSFRFGEDPPDPDVPVNLADYYDEDKVNGHLRESKSSGSSNSNSAAEHTSSSTSIHASAPNSNPHSHTALWITFILACLLLLSLQGYMFYLIRRTNYPLNYKDERILYKVPDASEAL